MKPMLAAATDGTNLSYPLLVSPKLDGVRALVIDGVVVSRSLKPIPNKYVQELFGKAKYNGLDGELIVGEVTAENVFQATTSGVMSIEGGPNVRYFVFDHYSPLPFNERLAVAESLAGGCVVYVQHSLIKSQAQLLRKEKQYLARGYEGLMARDPAGQYKHGRSTLKQGWLLKLKRFMDSEAKIIAAKELMHNSNEAMTNALGHKERSHKKAGMVSKNMLGAITVVDIESGVEFDIGTGFTEAQRQELWQQDLVGQLVRYKYQLVGVKEKPRFPVFLGFRSEKDL